MSNKTFQSLLLGVTCVSHIFDGILIHYRMKFSNFFFSDSLWRDEFLPGNILVFNCLKNKYQYSVFCCFKGETSMSSTAVHKLLGNSTDQKEFFFLPKNNTEKLQKHCFVSSYIQDF